HGQSHPDGHTPPFDTDLIGLHVDEIQAGLLDERLMHSLAVAPGSIPPTCYRSLIKAKGMDNCLDWTAIRQQRDHDQNQFRWLAQTLQHTPTSGAKRVAATATAIPLPFAIMNTDVALSDFASCGACQIRAKYLRHVHRLWLFCLHKNILPMVVTFFKSL